MYNVEAVEKPRKNIAIIIALKIVLLDAQYSTIDCKGMILVYLISALYYTT